MKGLTGELELESGNNVGSMLFYQGRILHALSPYSRAIGDLLVEDGLVAEAELIDTLKLQKTQTHTPIGCLFLHSGQVKFEIIEMMVHAQIREAVKEFMSWERLSFSFVKKEIQPYDKIRPARARIHPASSTYVCKAVPVRRYCKSAIPASRFINESILNIQTFTQRDLAFLSAVRNNPRAPLKSSIISFRRKSG